MTDETTTVVEEEEEVDAPSPQTTPWHIFGTACPKEEIVFVCQVIVLYSVILISIYNLSVGHENPTLWTALLSSSLGYLLPSPTLRQQDDRQQ
ncbi:hypothetical protein DJ031_00480 [bacterium endosymbiont of Escarpia laminata]|nr:MAG: hypothetical protein DJ031_00480 [bacterium endosymbiont of Escarpia laminata]